MRSLCEHAIQSKSEAALLYGVTKLRQLVVQVKVPRYQLFWNYSSDLASDYGAVSTSKFRGTGRHPTRKP